MKVRLIQAVVVGVFVMVGIVASQIDMFDNLACKSLTIEGKNANIMMKDGRIQFWNNETNTLAGDISFENAKELTGVLISCRAIDVSKIKDHSNPLLFDNCLTIRDDALTIKKDGAMRTSITKNVISVHGEKGAVKDKIHASIVVDKEQGGLIVLGNKSGDSKYFHTKFDDPIVIKSGEH